MRIAVTAEEQKGLESRVAQHFGRSPFFAFVEVDGRDVRAIEILPNPFASGHTHGQVPTFIKENNAEVMISGGMGGGALNFFESFGIETATGASGTIQQTLEKYFNGELSEAAPCQDHEDHHGHRHGHDHGQGHHD